VTQILHFLDDGEVGRLAEANAPAQFLSAGLQQMIERAALPRLRRRRSSNVWENLMDSSPAIELRPNSLSG
jgi:hypothetical protein